MPMRIEDLDSGRGPIPLRRSLPICIAAVTAMTYVRLVLFRDTNFSLSYAIPLLLCLWNRDKRLLWGMSVYFSFVSVYKIIVVVPSGSPPAWYEAAAISMTLLNIWAVAWVIATVIDIRERLVMKNDELTSAIEELNGANDALRSRDDEITSQYEELETRSDEIRVANARTAARERALQVLLESTRWQPDVRGREVLDKVCRAAVEAMEGQAVAAAIVEKVGDSLEVRGHFGFGDEGPHREGWTFPRSLAAVVMERKSTTYLKNLDLRPDLSILQSRPGHEKFRSVLASPILAEGVVTAVLEVFSTEVRDWSVESFQMVEWLAVQASLLLETVHYQEEVDRRGREAEESSIRKTRFLAAVSHDVRTPANSIGLIAELISRAAGDPVKRESIPKFAVDLKRSARSLVELVEDVLDLARFDSGRLDINLQEFPLAGLLEGEIRHHAIVAADKQIELKLEAPNEDLTLRTDRLKLARVVGNLIGNAVKFTERGGVTVSVVDEPGGGLAIRVRDTGIGIPAEHLESIFDEFFQLRNPERDRTKGNGLGLAICKRLADGLGLRLSVTSEFGSGTLCVIEIPVDKIVRHPDDSPPRTVEADPSGRATSAQSLAGMRILLVEDHEVTRSAMREILEAEGAEVSTAQDGGEALRLLRESDPTTVLLDLMLPDMDGTEVLRDIRARRPAGLQRVFVVSGDVSPQRVAEVTALGAERLIRKPLKPAELISALLTAVPS